MLTAVPDVATQLFWQAAGDGSWHEVVADSGHAQFCDAGPILNRVFAALCRTGSLPNGVRRNLRCPRRLLLFFRVYGVAVRPQSSMRP